MRLLRDEIKGFPELPGVYFFIDNKNNIIYIGKAKNIKQRLLQHLNQSKELLKKVSRIEYKVLNSELEALITEAILIYKYKPFYNIQFKYQKPLKYIVLINKDGVPYFDVASTLNEDISFFVGPFLNIYNFESIKKTLGNLFGIRLCKYNFNKYKPNLCMYYYSNYCSGICQNKIDLKQYFENLEFAIKFLSKDKHSIQNYITELYRQLEILKENLEYEKAIVLRNKIKTLERYLSNYIEDVERYYIYFSSFSDDIIFVALSKLYSNGLTNILKDTQIFELKNIKDLSKEQILLTTILEYIPNTNNLKEIKTNFYSENLVKILENFNNNESKFLEYFKFLENSQKSYDLNNINFKIIGLKLAALDQKEDKETIDYLENLIRNVYLKNQKFNKENIIRDLAKILNLKSINRIEAIDVSHFYGENVYGALIVFEKNKLKKEKYRIFKLNNKFDDISNIKELLERRIKYLINFEQYKDKSLNLFPQVILIDGGRNQLVAAYQVLSNYPQLLPIKLLSIVKPDDKILLLDLNYNHLKYDILELDLKRTNINLWNFLRMLRDQAHNYANSKRIKYSKLFSL
ncbi:MAG: GIY-YIG nuclease family protein [bacterium]|nr:GIY-YIG nuclease family protein [bacterium]